MQPAAKQSQYALDWAIKKLARIAQKTLYLKIVRNLNHQHSAKENLWNIHLTMKSNRFQATVAVQQVFLFVVIQKNEMCVCLFDLWEKYVFVIQMKSNFFFTQMFVKKNNVTVLQEIAPSYNSDDYKCIALLWLFPGSTNKPEIAYSFKKARRPIAKSLRLIMCFMLDSTSGIRPLVLSNITGM